MNSILLKNTVSIGGLDIYLYAICILTGVLVAYIIGAMEAKRLNIKIDDITDGLIICLPLSIIGARLYYVIFEWESYSHDLTEIFRIWNGGLAIHGGIIVAIVFILVYCKVKKLNLWKIFDVAFPAFLLAQAIGRWGNFFNQEAYGEIIKSQWIIDTLYNLLPDFIMDNMLGLQLSGYYNHPTFLYESFLNIIGFIVILSLRHFKFFKSGDSLPFYLIWYGVVRFMIEQTRTDALMIGNLRQNVLISAAFVIIGIGLFIFKRLYFKEIPYYQDLIKESNDEECNI